MSRHIIASGVLFLSFAAIVLAARYADEEALGRAPASLSKKEMLLGEAPVKKALLRHTEKIRGPLQTVLELVGTVPENKGDVFVLKGLVLSESDLQNVEFKWAIPKGLEVVNGTLAGQISHLKAGVPEELQVTLRSLEAINHQVHLIASGGNHGVRFAASAQYNTLLQQVIDESKDALAKSTEADAKKHRKPKVFQ